MLLGDIINCRIKGVIALLEKKDMARLELLNDINWKEMKKMSERHLR